MSETTSQHEPTSPEGPAGAEQSASSAAVRPARRKRRARRVVLVSATSVVAVVGAVALGGFIAVRHLEGNIHRIPNVFAGLDAARQPVMPTAARHSMTILMTGSPTLPAVRGGSGIDRSSKASEAGSGLIMLVHINANRKAGAFVSIPPNARVQVPGHGLMKIGNVLKFGGPSLLIGTVEQLTHVRIDHYSVVNFDGLAATLGPLGGVNVDIPDASTSNGHAFHVGINHLNGATALDYVREASLSEEGRVLRQQALLRAILDKLAKEHLLGDPTSALSVLNAFTKALSVDSNFSDSALQSLAAHLNLVGAGSGTFVTAPMRPAHLNGPISRQLWKAIRNDAVAAFARQYPSTVTTQAPN